ncbi:MAG TPA: ABC-type transport auxiliary lipoprotein family protein [Sphingomicrobium sp.]|nr:ABC-type transport auxiliary lipoprotein family protein [Sphingomicrobium sp.]
MSPLVRLAAAASLALFASACSLGGKVPAQLFTLTSEAPPAAPVRSAPTGETVTIEVPVTSEELRTRRVPVQISPSVVQYVKDLQWVDLPNRLFQDLVEETVRRRTGRVVLDPSHAGLDPGLMVAGDLRRFGYDAQTGMVVVQYDASLATRGGTHVQTRRFEASLPADGTAATVAPALNQAANLVALEVANWIGG